MKPAKIITIVITAVATFLLCGTALAQTQDDSDPRQMSQQEYEKRMEQISSSPEQQQAGMERFQQMSPEQKQAEIEHFQNMDPELQQKVMQQVQNAAPQMMQDAMPQFQGMDPQQIQDAMQERINDSLRDQMGITNDAEWAPIAEKISAVRKAQMAVLADSGTVEMMGVGGMGGVRRGGGFQNMLGRPSPESDALKQAVESDAPKTQIKTLTTKLRDVRKVELANLTKAQEELRALLTIRQQAVATLAGLLD